MAFLGIVSPIKHPRYLTLLSTNHSHLLEKTDFQFYKYLYVDKQDLNNQHCEIDDIWQLNFHNLKQLPHFEITFCPSLK